MSHKPTYEELEKRVQELKQAQLERKQSEEELAQIFSMSLDMICIADINTATFIKVNPAFTEILGFSEEAFLEKPFLDFVHPDDIDATRTVIERELKSGAKVINFANRYRCKDGSYRWLSWVSHPNLEQGLTFAIARDITELKQNQEDLEKSKSLLDATGRMARVGGWELGVDTLEVTWTEETYRIHELPLDFRPPLQDAINFFHPEDREQLEQAIQRALKIGEPYDMEIRFITAKGNHLWTRTMCQPEIVNGKIVKLKGTFQDITERKLAEESLSNSEFFLKSLLDAIPISVFYKDTDGRYLGFNKSFEDLLGKTADEIKGKTVFDINPPDLADTYFAKDQELFKTGEKQEYESQVQNVLGDRRDVIFNNAVFHNPEGNINGIIGTIQDVTDRKQAEDRIRKSEEKYRKLYEDAAIGIFHSSFEGQFLDVNPALAKMLGYETPQEVVDSIYNIAEQIYVEPPVRDEVIAQSLARGETIKVENLYRRKDGSEWNAYLYLRTVFDSNGQPICLEGFVEDISDRKRAEEALQESKIFLENMTDIAYTADDKGIMLWVNPAVEQVTGLPPVDIIGKPFVPLFIEADYASVVDVYKRTLAGASLENTLTFKSGVTCHFTSLPKRNSQGDIIGTFGVARDISDRLAAERALRESEEKFRNFTEQSFVGFYIIQDGLFKYVNPKFAEIFGYTVEECLNNMNFRQLVHPEDLTIVQEQIRKRVDGEIESSQYTFRGIKKTGEIIHVSIYGSSLIYQERPAAIGTMLDITKELEMEKRIAQAQRIEAIGSLAGGIAHDFNNILSPIVGMSEMLLEDLPRGSIESENVEQILKAGIRGSALVKQILAFSRQAEHKMVPTRIQYILKEILKLTRSTIPTYIDIIHEIDPKCGLIIADPTQIHQVAMNIVTNAYHAMETVGGKLTVQLKQVELKDTDFSVTNFKPGHYALLSISDTGHGMSNELIEKIFDPYFTTKEQGKGTGLGLAVVYGIVQEHNGIVKVYSELGKGTTFDIYLPLMRKPHRIDSIPKREESQGGNERLLLVDDEEPIANVEKQMLERLGYRVTSRLNSVDALEAFKANPHSFDLVITDMTMPNMTGDELAKELKKLKPDLPVIICTGFSERINKAKAEAIGINDFIMKPIVRSELANTVRKVLDQAQSKTQG